MKTNKTISKLVLALAVISFTISSCSTSNHSASVNTRGLNWVKANPKKATDEKKAVVFNETKKENTQNSTDIAPITVNQADLAASNTVPDVKPLSTTTTKKAVSTKGDVSVSKTSSNVNSSKELAAAKKEIKAQAKENKKLESKRRGGGKSQLVALLLCIFLGGLGIHRFYLGYIGIGILELLTGGVCGILALIDLIRIIIGDLQPKDGSYSSTL